MGIDIAGLNTAGRDELLEHWQSLIRRPPPKHISRSLLIQILAFELQTKLYGGYSKRLNQRLARAGLRDVMRPAFKPVADLCASIAERPMLLRWERMAALLGTRSASSPCLIRPAGAVRRMRTRIGLLAQPESMRSIIGATQ